MATPWWKDDERLLAALRRADEAAREVPLEFVAAGKAIFTWYDIDAELASMTYDSAAERGQPSPTRGPEHVPLRALIFATGEVTIELEVGQEALLGQLVPARPGTAYTHLVTGGVVESAIDESGCFVFRPAPSQAFRLQCRPASGTNVVTDWIAL
ncbi:hypothetical protein OUY22_34795 [Nonomuraea sp. MCN248]|uniref:Cupin domain-containing protein n=1 Tax=Nonomuraea corallina TaxID=2989783 RepID=A0ABT4SNF2_9ACTN|nr:hypothetical protein [Nonomuraea corallina]MDA0638605.1 hypothetical protein [Nonomuraea corallina]